MIIQRMKPAFTFSISLAPMKVPRIMPIMLGTAKRGMIPPPAIYGQTPAVALMEIITWLHVAATFVLGVHLTLHLIAKDNSRAMVRSQAEVTDLYYQASTISFDG